MHFFLISTDPENKIIIQNRSGGGGGGVWNGTLVITLDNFRTSVWQSAQSPFPFTHLNPSKCLHYDTKNIPSFAINKSTIQLALWIWISQGERHSLFIYCEFELCGVGWKQSRIREPSPFHPKSTQLLKVHKKKWQRRGIWKLPNLLGMPQVLAI